MSGGFVVAALLLLVAAVVVAAVAFRSRRATEALRVARRIGIGYAIAIVVLAAIYLWRDGGF